MIEDEIDNELKRIKGDDVITTEDLWKEVAKLYSKLGDKLDELNRLRKKKPKRSKQGWGRSYGYGDVNTTGGEDE